MKCAIRSSPLCAKESRPVSAGAVTSGLAVGEAGATGEAGAAAFGGSVLGCATAVPAQASPSRMPATKRRDRIVGSPREREPV